MDIREQNIREKGNPFLKQFPSNGTYLYTKEKTFCNNFQRFLIKTKTVSKIL